MLKRFSLSKRSNQYGKRSGKFRSNFERTVAEDLDIRNIEYEFEPYTIPYIIPAKDRTYLPDFILSNGIVIECKGWFNVADRQKMLYVRECNPNLDIRFVLMSPNSTISKKSKTTYAMWCDRHGFLWSDKVVPKEWLRKKKKKRKNLS